MKAEARRAISRAPGAAAPRGAGPQIEYAVQTGVGVFRRR
jgi:hypothetical protein